VKFSHLSNLNYELWLVLILKKAMDKFVLTLLLLEPTLVLRQSLRNWLEVDLAPCLIFEADNMPRAFDLALSKQPRIIILDLDMLTETVDDIQRLRELCPKSDIVGMGLDDTPSHSQRAELAGVAAFVSKSQLNSDLINTLKRITSIPKPEAHNG